MNAKLRQLVHAGLRITATKWLILGTLVGLICGVLGFAFYWATDVGMHLVLHELGGYQPPLPAGEVSYFQGEAEGGLRWWWILIALTLGGLLSGLLSLFAPDIRGSGADASLQAFHQNRGIIRPITTVMKFVASVVTLSSGGSAGREGPIALVGAGSASWLSQSLKLSSRDRRILLTAGVAGGVAAVFRAPLAGALFAAEVIYSDPDVEADGLIPGFISAIVAFCTFGVLEAAIYPGDALLIGSLFTTPDMLGFTAGDVPELIGYLLVSLAVVLVGRMLLWAVHGSQWLFAALPGPVWCKPAIGGLLTGLVALLVLGIARWSSLIQSGDLTPLATLGAGYGILQLALDGALGAPVALLLLIGIGKLVTSCCTVSSGGSGGLFGPSIVIGGCVGGAVGFALDGWTIAPHPAACVIMGMAAILAANFKTPIAALLMVSEMTGTYEMLLPAMWVCSLSYLLSSRRGILKSQMRSPVVSPAHRGHFFNDILAGIRVSQVFDPAARPARALRPESTIDECKRLVAESHQTVYPVVDTSGKLTGIFNLNDLRTFLFDDSLALVAVAQDVALDAGDIIAVSPHDSLASALRRFTEKNLEELPVVADDDPEHFLGLLTRREVIAYYNHVVDELRAQRKAEGWAQDDEPATRPQARETEAGR